jgi:porphobilinogen synthase
MLSRPRRNRANEAIRGLMRETVLLPSNLIYPLFLVNGSKKKIAIKSLPGMFRFSTDNALKEIEVCMKLGITSFVLFPVVDEKYKTKDAKNAYSKNCFYFDAIATIKKKFPKAFLISDAALDPYSSDGHDGLVKNGKILNDETLEVLGKMAVAQAESGIDMIGPSDMMDGRVQYIREELDDNGFKEIGIMSYTAKYASSFYGPFRDALDSAPKKGDKKTYQMDFANKTEALREAFLDESEGADVLMVKPALCYLDIIQDIKQNTTLPIAAYNVSGEYAMLKAAAQNGWLNYESAMIEMLTSIKRAGADMILTYSAKDFASWYKKNA